MSQPSGPSHWDKLPIEIKDMVLIYNTPLKLFLEGQFMPPRCREAKEIHKLWLEVFTTDWQGDLMSLPEPKELFEIQNQDLLKVKSRSMYDRLCRRFPSASEDYFQKRYVDIGVEAIIQSLDIAMRKPVFSPLKTPFRLIHVPMRHMWLDLLGDALDKHLYARANDCILEGHTDLFRHLVDTGKVDLNRLKRVCLVDLNGTWFIFNLMDEAAKRGHAGLLKILHETGCYTPTPEAMDGAAENGHLDIVKFLHKRRTEGCTTDAMDGAAKNGYLNVVKYLHENRSEGCTRHALYNAKSHGHLKTFKWLHENRIECKTYVMDIAAFQGELDVLKWLHENRQEGCTTAAMDDAASQGHLDVVKWLHKNRTEGCTTNALDNAARNGHTNVVRFLLANRSEGFTDLVFFSCPSHEMAIILAASLSMQRLRSIRIHSITRKWAGPGADVLGNSY